MQIEQAYDKVVLGHDDVQKILKDHIEKATGRKVRGDVYVQSQTHTMRGIPSKMVVTGSHAHTYLEPAVPVAKMATAPFDNQYALSA
jgi:hypothetical protein